jgi:predicted nucleic acid-binding protein
MMVSFDTNILVYATISAPLSKAHRARDLLVRGMRTGTSILLLQTLAEFSSVAIRKAGIAVDKVRTMIDAWRAVLPVQGTEDDDLSAALDAVKKHRLAFWDAMLWAAAQRAGVVICSPRTCRMALNWQESDSSIRSKQRTIG